MSGGGWPAATPVPANSPPAGRTVNWGAEKDRAAGVAPGCGCDAAGALRLNLKGVSVAVERATAVERTAAVALCRLRTKLCEPESRTTLLVADEEEGSSNSDLCLPLLHSFGITGA